MRYQITKDSVTIPREAIQKNGRVVALPLKEYRELQERAVPTYQLYGKEAEELDKLVEEGLRDYEEGRTIEASSLDEALKIYEKRQRSKKN